ncbi:lipid-transfer protein [Sphingomonas fennica]|uniref:Lipid-transfer protein n=2 Tax=Alphaproteobacteria TaxID=28211 RepID=A0A2T4HW87_9SPHN|nr:lipid-transfer protein [Sphingomonas fennica]
MVDRNAQAAIVGIGQTEFSRNSGRSEQQLMAEAVLAALDDAGLSPKDVDGCLTFDLDNSDEVDLMRNLGVEEIKYTLRTPQGGASSVTTLVHAKKAVESGFCDVMVVWRAMNERSAYRFGQPNLNIQPSGRSSTFIEWCFPYGAQTPAVWEALSCAPYMNRYGVTSEDLGRIAVLLRSNAATNPIAWFHGKPITLEDHQNSKWIVAPWLHLLDCCQESDGGVALVIARADRARDTKNKPARILGAEYAFLKNHEIISDYYEGDLTELAVSQRVTERLTRAAGIAPRETNVAMIYDNFTPQILRQTEGFGFCGRGEAKDYIRDGHMNLDGRTPLSPNGGLMGEAYIHGMNNITEGVRQLRGTAANQVKNVETVFCASGVAGAILGL